MVVAESVQLDTVAAEAWEEFRRFASAPDIVAASMPILYFGDSRSYFASKCRIVTVGLNPSRTEFPAHRPTLRFPAIMGLPTDCPSRVSLEQYRGALDSYFCNDPYHWFRCFRAVLAGLDSSYDEARANQALHTDLCSPLATDPTWSRLSPLVQQGLQAGGVRLWHRLMVALLPHAIIISVKGANRALIDFPAGDDWEVVHESGSKADGSARKRLYRVLSRRVAITETHFALLVFAPAAQTPFGPASSTLQLRIGREIRERL
jgi:hypothetical protein